jgi:hypothetical protein
MNLEGRLIMEARASKLVYVLVAVLAVGASFFVVQARQNQAKAKTVTITGCLQKGDEANEFAITGEDGKKYELTSKQVALKDHVGHKVTVTGTLRREERDADEDESKEGWAGQVRVTSLKMVTNSCS